VRSGGEELSALEAAAQAMAARGMRVLGVAMAKIPADDPASALADYRFSCWAWPGWPTRCAPGFPMRWRGAMPPASAW
jgi:hypothetical protein